MASERSSPEEDRVSRSKQQEAREGNYSEDKGLQGAQIVGKNDQNHALTPGAADKFEKEPLEINIDDSGSQSTED